MAINKHIIRAVLRGAGYREIVAMFSCSNREVSAVKRLIEEHSITLETLEDMTARDIQTLVTSKKPERVSMFMEPDFEHLVTRLAANKYYTLLQGWREYCKQAGSQVRTYSYSRFCQRFNTYVKHHNLTAKLNHSPGRLMMVDWAGSTVALTESFTGKKTYGYMFVATLPYSGMVYAEAFPTMASRSWLQGHLHAFEYFNGVPEIVVPDNLRTAITSQPSTGYRFLNRDYEQFAAHYEFGIMPTRVRKPKDKGSVEAGVHVVNLAVSSVLHDMEFRTWEVMNRHIRMLVDEVNARPFRGNDVTRRSLFTQEEADMLKPLPAVPYAKVAWSKSTVRPDYHVQVDYRMYSVPFMYVGKTVTIKRTDHELAIMHDGDIIAQHETITGRKGLYRTDPNHVPKHHEGLNFMWTEKQFEQRASTIGAHTTIVIQQLLQGAQHASQAFMACENVLQLAKKYGSTVLEEACAIVNDTGMSISQTAVLTMVKSLASEKKEKPGRPVIITTPTVLSADDHIRGGDYYETSSDEEGSHHG